MARLARNAAVDPAVRRVAAEAVAGCGPSDDACRSQRILAYVRTRARFLPDPAGVELVTDPRALAADVLARGEIVGDCDDVAAFTAALARSVGLAARFIAASWRPDGLYNHVWTEIGSGGRWWRLDPFRAPGTSSPSARLAWGVA